MKEFKSNHLKRLLSLVLALVMVITMIPFGAFAETFKDKEGNTKTTDWSKKARKKQEDEVGHWPLSMKNRLVRVSPADPLKTPRHQLRRRLHQHRR